MAQSLENRMTDIIIAHLPDDLNARFAGVDVKIATIRETQLLHTQRFTTIERKIDQLDLRMVGVESGMDGLDGRMAGLEGRMVGLEGRMDRLESRIDGLDAKINTIRDALENKIDAIRDTLESKIDLILIRLPGT